MSEDDKTALTEDDEKYATMRERELALAEEMKRKAAQEEEYEVDFFAGMKDSATGDPVQPVKLTKEDRFCFSCHKGVSCWNKCCYGHDITLTPFDILRLSRHLEIKPAEFLKIFTVPAMWEGADLPIAKLRVQGADGTGPCVFLDEEEGCTVYENRPVNCRYYPLGLAAIKMKGTEQAEDFFFLVRESHCKGHEEPKEQTLGAFREEQGIEEYDQQNAGWIELLMKTTSWRVLGGPYMKPIDKRTQQMFFMATTDVETFRRFVFETKFLQTYDIDEEMQRKIKRNDEALLQLAFDWLHTIIFNDHRVPMKDSVMQDAIAKARVDFRKGS